MAANDAKDNKPTKKQQGASKRARDATKATTTPQQASTAAEPIVEVTPAHVTPTTTTSLQQTSTPAEPNVEVSPAHVRPNATTPRQTHHPLGQRLADAAELHLEEAKQHTQRLEAVEVSLRSLAQRQDLLTGILAEQLEVTRLMARETVLNHRRTVMYRRLAIDQDRDTWEKENKAACMLEQSHKEFPLPRVLRQGLSAEEARAFVNDRINGTISEMKGEEEVMADASDDEDHGDKDAEMEMQVEKQLLSTPPA